MSPLPRLLITAALVATAFLPAGTARAQQEPGRGPWKVFAFCHDTHDARKRSFKQQAAMLKRLEFDGVGHIGLEQVQERIVSLDNADLQLFLAGITIDLTKDIDAQLQPLRDTLPVLKERQLTLYTVVTGLPPGSPQGLETAVTAVQELCDIARTGRIRIALYPHTGDWVATVPQAIKLAKRVQRENCGVVFNLCHFLRNEDPATLNEVLRDVRPFLVAVTINGADLAGRNDKDWKRLIQPLDQGDFDVAAFMGQLQQIGYQGPVGIMCYGIGGNAADHLERSIEKWQELVRK